VLTVDSGSTGVLLKVLTVDSGSTELLVQGADIEERQHWIVGGRC